MAQKTKAEVKTTKKKQSKHKRSFIGQKGVPVKTLKKHLPTLAKISKLKSRSRISNIIDQTPNSGINAVCECLYNVLYSKNINQGALEKLKKLDPTTKFNIREVVQEPVRGGFSRKRRLLKQSGGSLGAILAAALPLLVNLIRKAFRK